ncbi:MAG TPA: porin, partial [Thermoanaerobaculia bacterium]|nr:porin [Thermoanaerobaculia bacterium]
QIAELQRQMAELRQQVAVPQQPAVQASDEVPAEAVAPPTTEELAGKMDSFGEAFTETRNQLELVSRMKFSGYIQAQYVNDERSRNELGGATGTRNLDQFSVRRARVKFTYQATPTSRFVLQPDITSSGVTLKDGYAEFTEPWTAWKNTLTAGQFNWPFGFEIMYSSSSREMPERSRVIRTLFPGERDRGVMLSGLGLTERLRYQVAVVNGTGTVRSDDLNKRKDLVGRVGYSFGAFDLGTSLYRGSDLIATSTNAAGLEFDKDRQGIDFQWATPLPGFGVRGEYITGKQPPAAGTSRTESQDVDGWYFYAIQNLGTRHQLVARLDEYDPDTDVDDNATKTIGGSYIFHWDANSKVMVTYERPELEINDPDDNVFTLRYQYAF